MFTNSANIFCPANSPLYWDALQGQALKHRAVTQTQNLDSFKHDYRRLCEPESGWHISCTTKFTIEDTLRSNQLKVDLLRMNRPKKRRVTAGIGALLLVLLLVAYISAPIFAKHYLNKYVLADIGDYTGHVDSVDLKIFKGTYVLHDLVVYRKGGNRDIPFFAVRDFSVYLSWEALRNGALLVSVTLKEAQLAFLDAKKEQNRQSGEGGNWLTAFENLIPTTLHELKVVNSRLSFQNTDTEPPVQLQATDINGRLTNLTNVKDRDGRRVATAEVAANLLNGANANVHVKFDPFSFGDFDLAFKAEDVSLVELNSFSKAYGNVDFEDGSGSVFAEITAKDGQMEGYIKPLFENVNILSWQQDVAEQGDNPLQLLWEGGVGFIKTLLTNSSSDKVATRIEISGSIESAEIDSWQAVGSLIKNAFAEALRTRFDNLTDLTSEED